jgi:hypothetical protein
MPVASLNSSTTLGTPGKPRAKFCARTDTTFRPKAVDWGM